MAATYTLRPDGRVTVVNECRRKDGQTTRVEGEARRADEKGPASRLKVRFAPAWMSFLPFVWGDYWIVELDRDYRYAVVGDPARKYLWILSRSPRDGHRHLRVARGHGGPPGLRHGAARANPAVHALRDAAEGGQP